jgi:hypothetical protein
MALNPSIILSGRGVDVLGAMGRGNEIAAQTNALRSGMELQNLYRTQGANMLAGDQGALNALAGIDPAAALGLKESHLGMQETRTRMDILTREEQRKIEEYKATAGAAKAAEAAAKLEGIVSGAAQLYDRGDRAGFAAFLTQNGVDPAQYPFDQFPAHAAKVLGTADALKLGREAAPADEYGRYAQEEAAAGRTPLNRLEFEQAKKGKGMSFTTTNPDGSQTTISMGGAQGGETTVGEVYNPNEISSVVSLIDQIAEDPELPGVLGNKALVLGGGNMVTELNLAQRMGYGTGGISAIEKIGQLQSNAWLSARAMLKGGGAITDYESKKAEAAVARLERPKSEADFRAALKELRDAITEGERKLRESKAGRGQPAPQAGAAPQAAPAPGADMTDDDLLRMYGGE